MKFGLSKEDYSLLKSLLFDPLKEKSAKLWVFGSRARGDHKPFSDVDVLYSASTKLPLGFISEIKESLEESRLPIKVDLVSVEDLAESYRESVERDKIEI